MKIANLYSGERVIVSSVENWQWKIVGFYEKHNKSFQREVGCFAYLFTLYCWNVWDVRVSTAVAQTEEWKLYGVQSVKRCNTWTSMLMSRLHLKWILTLKEGVCSGKNVCSWICSQYWSHMISKAEINFLILQCFMFNCSWVYCS